MSIVYNSPAISTNKHGASVQVNSHDSGNVLLSSSTPGFSASIHLSPETARELASELLAAADSLLAVAA